MIGLALNRRKVYFSPMAFYAKECDSTRVPDCVITDYIAESDEPGLYYCGMRYYNSAIGRWINRDPIWEDGGLLRQAFINSGLARSR